MGGGAQGNMARTCQGALGHAGEHRKKALGQARERGKDMEMRTGAGSGAWLGHGNGHCGKGNMVMCTGTTTSSMSRYIYDILATLSCHLAVGQTDLLLTSDEL